jgi:glycosyltransferase involved in cell wall biosynthesis
LRVLIGVENYYPSIGGVQEVMRQIATRLAAEGVEVSVATSSHVRRSKDAVIDGVRVVSFPISGNRVRGMSGPVSEFQDYLCCKRFDAVMIKAAQQWSFDAAVPVLGRIAGRKVFIPCGFSGLHDPMYADYYRHMPGWLRLFDALIFYSEQGQDLRLARECGIGPLFLVTNGVDEAEFAAQPRIGVRDLVNVPEGHDVLVTVGSRIPLKGHWDLVRAFGRANLSRPTTLVVNANVPGRSASARLASHAKSMLRGHAPLSIEGARVRLLDRRKAVRIVDLPRRALIEMLREATLFVLASKFEYAPLVLYEAVAAGTPFLSTDVGNAREIAQATGAGLIVKQREIGTADSMTLARGIEALMADPARLSTMRASAQSAFARGEFLWKSIYPIYRAILSGQALPAPLAVARLGMTSTPIAP